MPNTPQITTAGSLLIKSQLPNEASKKNFDLYTPLDKKGMSTLVNMLLTHGGDQAGETINNLGKQFFNKATEIGASTPLSDYINDSDERQAIIQEYSHKVETLKAKEKNAGKLNAALGDLTGQYNTRIAKQNIDYLLSKGSMAARMANTGARGNSNQLASATSTPLMSLNIKGELVPLVIKHGFAEGMTPAEHLAMAYMGRASTVLSQLSTALPGALFKRLSPTMFHETITCPDCGTHNGILNHVDDKKSVIGRFEAETNKLIDEVYQREMVASGRKTVKIRSSLTCEAHDGLCQKCYGLAANAKLPNIGENVGVIAAQSVSEVLTQAMLSTKHRATVGERKGNSYDQASNLLNNPAENFKDEATIATNNGKVDKIQVTPLGDYNVFINGTKHFVPIAQQLKVKAGDDIKQGDSISTGVINPRKLVALRGLGSGREYMAKELRDIYGGGLDPRHFELIARNLMKYVQVTDPGESGFLTGDKISVNNVAKYLKDRTGVVPIEKAEGKVLAKGTLMLTPGTLLDGNHIADLKAQGIKTVDVASTKLKVTPIVPGLQTNKMLDKNWISRLSFSKLKETILNAAALGEESAVHSTDPITPYILGTEFGDAEDGKY